MQPVNNNIVETIHIPQPGMTCDDILWDVVSVILVPIGIYRLISYVVGRAIALLMCGRSEPQSGVIHCGQVTHHSSRRWIVICGSMGSSIRKRNLPGISEQLEANVISYTYRRDSSCFNDLVEDGKLVVRYLREQGVQHQDIFIDGHSLGAAIALQIGSQLQLPTVVHNAFSSMSDAVDGYLNANSYAKIKDKFKTHQIGRMFIPFMDIVLKPITLVLRLSELFNNVFECEWELAWTTTITIVTALFFDTLYSLLAIVAFLTSPCTNIVLEEYLNLTKDDSPKEALSVFAKGILSFSGWSPDNTAPWNALERNKLAFVSTQDELFQNEASLKSKIGQEQVVEKPGRHSATGHGHARYREFLHAPRRH